MDADSIESLPPLPDEKEGCATCDCPDDLPTLPDEKAPHETILPYHNTNLGHDFLFIPALPLNKVSHHSSKSCLTFTPTTPDEPNTDPLKTPFAELKQTIAVVSQKGHRPRNESDPAPAVDLEGTVKKPRAAPAGGFKNVAGGYLALKKTETHLGSNYIKHVLNQREIYMQYVAIMKGSTLAADLKITTRQFQALTALAPSYLKNSISHLGNFFFGSPALAFETRPPLTYDQHRA